jgi:hypothetical protein
MLHVALVPPAHQHKRQKHTSQKGTKWPAVTCRALLISSVNTEGKALQMRRYRQQHLTSAEAKALTAQPGGTFPSSTVTPRIGTAALLLALPWDGCLLLR